MQTKDFVNYPIAYGGLKLATVIAAMISVFAVLTSTVHICVGTFTAMAVLWVAHQRSEWGWWGWLAQYVHRNIRATVLEYRLNPDKTRAIYRVHPYQRPLWYSLGTTLNESGPRIVAVVSGWRQLPILGALIGFLTYNTRRAYVVGDRNGIIGSYKLRATYTQYGGVRDDADVRLSWTDDIAHVVDRVGLTDTNGTLVVVPVYQALLLLEAFVKTRDDGDGKRRVCGVAKSSFSRIIMAHLPQPPTEEAFEETA